jgi:hypothetical protein
MRLHIARIIQKPIVQKPVLLLLQEESLKVAWTSFQL